MKYIKSLILISSITFSSLANASDAEALVWSYLNTLKNNEIEKISNYYAPSKFEEIRNDYYQIARLAEAENKVDSFSTHIFPIKKSSNEILEMPMSQFVNKLIVKHYDSTSFLSFLENSEYKVLGSFKSNFGNYDQVIVEFYFLNKTVPFTNTQSYSVAKVNEVVKLLPESNLLFNYINFKHYVLNDGE